MFSAANFNGLEAGAMTTLAFNLFLPKSSEGYDIQSALELSTESLRIEAMGRVWDL